MFNSVVAVSTAMTPAKHGSLGEEQHTLKILLFWVSQSSRGVPAVGCKRLQVQFWEHWLQFQVSLYLTAASFISSWRKSGCKLDWQGPFLKRGMNRSMGTKDCDLPTAVPPRRALPVTTVRAHPEFASCQVLLSNNPLTPLSPLLLGCRPAMAALGSSFSSAGKGLTW